MLNFERVKSIANLELDDSFAEIFEEMLSYEEGTFADAARIIFYSNEPASVLLETNGFKAHTHKKLVEHYQDRILLLAKAGNAGLFKLNIKLVRPLLEAGVHSRDELEYVLDLCGNYLPHFDKIGKGGRAELYTFLGREEPAWVFPCYVRRVSDGFYHNKTNQWRKVPCEIKSLNELDRVVLHCYRTNVAIKVVTTDVS